MCIRRDLCLMPWMELKADSRGQGWNMILVHLTYVWIFSEAWHPRRSRERRSSGSIFPVSASGSLSWICKETLKRNPLSTFAAVSNLSHKIPSFQSGHAYRCFCTPDQLSVKRERLARSGSNLTYDKTCLHLTEEEVARRVRAGEKSVVRLNVRSHPMRNVLYIH